MAVGRPRKFDYDDALDHAMRVFWEKGYEGTSMPDLTKAMGMNRPSIYAAYGNKLELFCKSLNRYTEKKLELVSLALDRPTIQEAIETLMSGAVDSLSCDQSPKGCMSVQGALACSDEAKIAQHHAIQRREKIVEVITDRFRRSVESGELPESTDCEDFARFFVTVVQGLAIQSANGVDYETLRKIAMRSLSVLPKA